MDHPRPAELPKVVMLRVTKQGFGARQNGGPGTACLMTKRPPPPGPLHLLPQLLRPHLSDEDDNTQPMVLLENSMRHYT